MTQPFASAMPQPQIDTSGPLQRVALGLGRGRLIALSFLGVVLTPLFLNIGLWGTALGALVFGELLLLLASRAERPHQPMRGLLAIEANTLAASAYMACAGVYLLLGQMDLAAGLGLVATGKLLLSILRGEPCSRLCLALACLLPGLYLSMRLFFADVFARDPLFAEPEVIAITIIVDVLLTAGAVTLLQSLVREGTYHPAVYWLPLTLVGILVLVLGLLGLLRGEIGASAWLAVKGLVLAGLGIRSLIWREEDHPRAF